MGDTHLGAGISLGKVGIGSALNSRIIDQLNLLDWVLDQAILQEADDIILTGDIFEDPKPASYLITLFISWLKKCQIYNINVRIVRGNHCILRSGFNYHSVLDIIDEVELENVSIYKDINTIFIGKTAFTFIPFRDRKSFGVKSNAEAIEILTNTMLYEYNAIPSDCYKVCIGHLAIEGSIPVGDEIDDLTNELFCPLEIFNGYDFVWFGHVHKYQILQQSNPMISHIGSMDLSNFSENNQKKYIVMLDNDNNQYSLEALPTRPLKKISFSIEENTLDTTEFALNYLSKITDLDRALVKVEITLESPNLALVNKQLIEKQLLSQGAFHISSIVESKKNIIQKKTINQLSNKMDLSSAVKSYADLYIEEAEKNLFIELSLELYKISLED